jgi:hypothetical protein
MQTVTPLDPANKALHESSSEALLDAIVQLTHRIHGLTDAGQTARVQELRVQRGLLRGEVLRRMGGAR